jgi:hypothetical protein
MSKKSKFTGKAKVATPVVETPEQPPTSTRTIVAIAKELKITPVNARRLARQHASELGHANKNDRWALDETQAKRFIELATAPKAKHVAT